MTDTYAYRAFGAAWQGGNGSTNAYRYAGEYGYYRDSAAVEYVRARHLNVLQGRWMSADPLRFEAGDYNLYRYVGNEPVAGVDPSGLECVCGCHGKRCQCKAPPHQPPGFKCKTGKACYITCFSDHRIAYGHRYGCPKRGEVGVCATYCPKYGSPSCPPGDPLSIRTHSGGLFHRCKICDCGSFRHNEPTERPDCWIDVWGSTEFCRKFASGWYCVTCEASKNKRSLSVGRLS